MQAYDANAFNFMGDCSILYRHLHQIGTCENRVRRVSSCLVGVVTCARAIRLAPIPQSPQYISATQNGGHHTGTYTNMTSQRKSRRCSFLIFFPFYSNCTSCPYINYYCSKKFNFYLIIKKFILSCDTSLLCCVSA